MRSKSAKILPLGTALGSLVGTAVVAMEAQSAIPTAAPSDSVAFRTAAEQMATSPNMLVSTGETLLGFVLRDQPDGTVVAQHSSHASHASHHSHYSSR